MGKKANKPNPSVRTIPSPVKKRTRTKTNGPRTSVADGELRCRLTPNSRVTAIGMGGVGTITVRYLAVFLRSLRIPVRLVLIDGDRISLGNLTRTPFQGVGDNKAEEQAAEISAMLGACDVTVVAVPEFVTEENLSRLIRNGDHVLLCVDNHETRRLVSDHCQTLSDVALFSGGNDGVAPPRERGTYGNVQIAVRHRGRDLTAPLTRYHPEIAQAQGQGPKGLDCAQAAVSTPQILFTNLAVASALLNSFFAHTCGRLAYQEVQLDILEARTQPLFPLPWAESGMWNVECGK